MSGEAFTVSSIMPKSNRLPRVVSVIVPAYCAADTLGECLNALQHQQLPPGVRLEIIVADDHSSDDTVAVAREAGVICVTAEPDADTPGPEPDWVMWRPAGTAPSSGPGATRNRGVAVSTGDPILFTDADCVPTPGWVAAMLKAFDDPQVAGVKGAYLTHQRNWAARFTQLEYAHKYQRMGKHEWIDFVDTYSAGYRRKVFLENGGFETAMMVNEDHELSFRLAQKGYRLKFVPEATVYHRHLTSVRQYLRRKFTIGYWKMQLLRWHPDKALSDSHTPASQRWQLLLVGPLLAVLVLSLFWPPARLLALGLAAAFGLTTLPFLWWVARNDWPILGIALPMLVGRAAAQVLGLGIGALAALRRKPIREAPLPSGAQIAKRTLDIVVASLGLIISAPIMLVLALAIKLETPGSALFRQTRIGQHGRPFQILKLRSMVEDAEVRLTAVLDSNPLPGPAFKIPNDPRVTRLGQFMRRWSLDELPQLWNVLRGEMSLVGPRPEEAWVVAQYNDVHRRRLAVKPGLTGPMQVNGRGNLPLEARVKLELDYIEHYSLVRDAQILLRSIPEVISGRGAY
jgi:lipopolysaccharide/colanic/teichoic acid biosynthesis glycosyltransferase/glycosyltransferase involved in cell wall biosynthesis